MGSSTPEFNLVIKDKVGLSNVVADHLSRLGPEATPSEELPINDSFPDEQLLAIFHQVTPWYVNLVNFKVCGVLPLGLSHQQREKFLFGAKYCYGKTLFSKVMRRWGL